MISVIVSADAWLQRRFNGAVHALMRRTGVTKRVLRRNAWAMHTAAAASAFVYDAVHVSAWILLAVPFCALDVINAAHDDEADRLQERYPGTASAADERGRTMKLWGWPILVFDSLFFAFAPDVRRAVWLSIWVTMLLLGYLCGVPPQAPKKREEPRAAALQAAAGGSA